MNYIFDIWKSGTLDNINEELSMIYLIINLFI